MKAQAKPDGNETVLFEQTLYPWCLFSCLFCCPGTSSIAIFLLTPRLQCGTASRPSVSTLHRAAAWGTWIALIFVVSRTWSLIATAVRCASTGILLHLLQYNMPAWSYCFQSCYVMLSYRGLSRTLQRNHHHPRRRRNT